MRAGKLRARVTIEQPDGEVTEGYNSSSRVFVAWEKDVHVEILGVSGGETFRGVKVEATTTHLVHMRWIEGLTTLMRFDWGGRKLNILSILEPDVRRRELNVVCKETI